MPVISRGSEAAKKLVASMDQMRNMEIRVGIHGEEGALVTPDGATISMIAACHEYGLGGLPERSFIGSWMKKNRERNQKIISAELQRAILKFIPSEQVLRRIGVVFVGDVQARMARNMITPDISEATKQAKGSSTVLIDTGQLRSSIRSTVRIGSGGWKK